MKKRFWLLSLLVISLFILSCTPPTPKLVEEFPPETKNVNELPVQTAEEPSFENHKTPNYQEQSTNYNQVRGCKGSGPVTFTVSPRKMEDFGMFVPMGLMVGDHVTPIDHGYFYPPNWKMDVTSAELKDVYVPAAGVITTIQRMPDYFKTTQQADLQDYRVIIHHTCTFYTIYIHLNLLSPRITEIIGEIQPSESKNVEIEVKAGELLGRANSFDFSVHNEDITLTGFITPKNYEGESWKIHTVDPTEYFVEPIRSQILAKNPRTAEPRGGKIDYDIDGKLIGNWFLEGTNGYAGVETQPNYWVSHLAFAPNAYDPSHFIISLGEFEERYSRQYVAKGNLPNPANVEVSSGLIKYELVEFDYIDGSGKTWDSRSYSSGIKVRSIDDQKRGTILAQLLEDRRLKVEVFSGKTPSEVSGFTSKAKIYYR